VPMPASAARTYHARSPPARREVVSVAMKMVD
jgi:hypothetical protein